MHPAYIQAELKKRGITQIEIANELGICDMTVSKVINGQSVSDRVMRAVAEKICMDHRVVFAWYYSKPKKRSSSKAADCRV